MADNEQGTIPKPEVTEEHKKKAEEMATTIDDDRPTVAMPGTSNTVTGTAVNEWLDDDGSPKYGEVENEIKHEDVMGERHKTMSEDEG